MKCHYCAKDLTHSQEFYKLQLKYPKKWVYLCSHCESRGKPPQRKDEPEEVVQHGTELS